MKVLIGYMVADREVELQKHFFATFREFMQQIDMVITTIPLPLKERILLFGIYAQNWKDTNIDRENVIV